MRLGQKVAEIGTERDRFEPFRAVISFRKQAADWFRGGDEQQKRLILETVGSNLILKGKILSIEAVKPFATRQEMDVCLYQLAGGDDVRTLKKKRPSKKAFHKFVDEVLIALNADPRRDHILENITKLQQSFDPKEDRKAA